jgi:hypothetical protein
MANPWKIAKNICLTEKSPQKRLKPVHGAQKTLDRTNAEPA